MADDRHSNPDPERSGPYRAFDNFFRWPDLFAWWLQPPGTSDDPDRPCPPDSAWAATIQRAVEAGYRLTEAQIKQGYEVAERFNRQFSGMGRAGTDFQDLTNRMLWSTYDVAAGWVEFMSSLPASMMSMVAQPAHRNGGGRGVAVAIKSPRSARVDLDLRPGAETEKLSCNPLQSPESKRSISKIEFESDDDGGETVLRIEVKDNMPAGVYSGAVQDEHGYPQGTLTVVLE